MKKFVLNTLCHYITHETISADISANLTYHNSCGKFINSLFLSHKNQNLQSSYSYVSVPAESVSAYPANHICQNIISLNKKGIIDSERWSYNQVA